MSDLTGNLGPFGLRHVLGFLAGAGVTGELRVLADGVDGRVLFQDGSVAYATTATGEGTLEELDSLLDRYQRGEFDGLAPGDGETPASLEDVLREQLTEVLYYLTQFDSGSFGFTELPDRSGSPEDDTFFVDELLRQVDNRIEEWREIRRVVPSNDTDYQLVSHIPAGRPQVTVSAPMWTLLAAVGERASVTDVAAAMGMYEFHVARKIADLVEDGLLETSDGTGWNAEPTSAVASADEAEPGTGWHDDAGSQAEDEWQSDVEAVVGSELPRVEPTTDAVTFSKGDLSREEMDEMIRNIGRGVFPS